MTATETVPRRRPEQRTPRAARRRSRRQHLSRADRVVLTLMAGVPLLLTLSFVWLPALQQFLSSPGDISSILSKVDQQAKLIWSTNG